MRELAAKAQIANAAFLTAVQEDLLRLGAVHVNEVLEEDWQKLPSWIKLHVFEQRRFLATLLAGLGGSLLMVRVNSPI